MISNNHTVVRADPFKDESPFTVLIRSCDYNGWSSPTAFASVATGLDSSTVLNHVSSKRHVRALSESLEFAQTFLESVAYLKEGPAPRASLIWQGLRIPAKSLRHRSTAVCHWCLASDVEPYGRKEWDHRLVQSCRHHKRRLLTRCPSCNWPISTYRAKVAFCNCGFDFRTAPATDPSEGRELRVLDACMEAKDPDRLNAALAVHCCLGDAAAVDALSDGVMVDDALERIYFDPSSTPALFKQPCGTMRGTSVRIALRKLLPHQRIPVIAAILGSFDAPKHLLVGGSWECNLMESVSGMQAQSILGIDDQPFRRLRDAGIIPTTRVPGSRSYFVELSVLDELLRLGIQSRTLHQSRRSLRAMRNTNHVAVYSGLRDGSVLSGGYKVGSGLRSLRVAFDRPASDRCPDPTLAEVAALAQVHYHYIQQLVKVGFLKAYKRKGNKFYIAAQDADSFINTYVFAGPLARSKGIHYPNFVRHLISSGHAPVSGPSIDGGRVYLFRRSDLLGGGPSDEHPTRLNTRTAASPRVDVTCMKLRDLCNELKISSPTGTGLLNRGFISEVHRIGGDVHISIESVERYREVLTSSEWIDLQDAADLANESIAGFRRRWVLSGLVEELDLMLVRRVRASDLSRVLTLKDNFLTGGELAQSLRIPRSFGCNQFKIGRLPSFLLGMQPHTIRIYPKSAIEELLTSEQ